MVGGAVPDQQVLAPPLLCIVPDQQVLAPPLLCIVREPVALTPAPLVEPNEECR